MFVKCDCENCGGSIEFDEKDDERVCSCPHCGKETTLKAPKPAFSYQKPPSDASPIAQQFPIKKMNQDTAGGCFFSLLGAVLLIGGLYGLLLSGSFWGVPAIIVSLIIFASSWSLSKKFVCTNCGNRVDGEQVKLCPTCKVELYKKPGWW